MGGKGDDSSNSDEQYQSMMRQQHEQQLAAAAEITKKKAAEPVTEDTTKKTEEPVTEAPKTEEPMGDNLTGLGDDLVSGLSTGRSQVDDQLERLKADPATYGKQFDPYTGTYVGTTKQTGQV